MGGKVINIEKDIEIAAQAMKVHCGFDKHIAYHHIARIILEDNSLYREIELLRKTNKILIRMLNESESTKGDE